MSSRRSGTLNSNYVKASSQNLPRVDLDMLLDYVEKSFKSAETRGTKVLRSMRESYGNGAIGYVQLNRENLTCTVQAKVCPEHKIHYTNYKVIIVVDEDQDSIQEAKCLDCAASEGECKHAVAVVAWLYRKSETPAPTSITCYWDKPYLSEAIAKIKYLTIEELFYNTKDGKENKLEIKNNDFFKDCVQTATSKTYNSHLTFFYRETDFQKLTLHHRAIAYTGDKSNVTDFMNYCSQLLKLFDVVLPM